MAAGNRLARYGNPKLEGNRVENPYLDNSDLVMGFDFIDHPNYIRMPFSYLVASDKMRHDYKRPGKCEPAKKPYFACFLVSNRGDWLPGKFNGATARDRMFHKLSLYKKVQSGGKHLNNIGGIVSNADTYSWIDQCKFMLAYENTLDYPGYVTEKPFQAWFGGAVPIYNTHEDGLVDVNKKSLLYAGDFESEEDFIEHIKKVDNDDDLYCKYWNEQIIDNPDNDYKALQDRIRVKLNEILDRKLKR